MGLMEAAFKQFRKPTGWLGTLAGIGMNVEHARLWRWALTHVTIQPEATILDVGCGGGKTVHMLAHAAPGGKVYGVDYSQDVLRLARRVNQALIRDGRVKVRQGMVSSLPFSDHTFDLVTAFETHLFWPDLVADLREVRRVLKPGGTLLMASEAYKHESFEERNARWARLAGFHNLHTPEETREYLTEAGYTAVEINVVPERNWIAAVANKP
jgi:ubiquinone/menaquinone biosynthesis C-methylase UbiE